MSGSEVEEGVIQALMETLVDPRLPYSFSANDPPSMDAQNSVAKQMHAVVLLYNYYHRKQKPELEFLDFVSFCILARSLRLTLTMFMKMTSESELLASSVSEHWLSVTEKAIKDACNIAIALDSSKDVPTIEGCPISKVAALVIDSKRENCLLQFGAVTEGVWSLLEKDIDEGNNIDREIVAYENVGMKRKSSGRDSKFLQIAFDSVKDVTGIDRADLEVLETHVTYSLSKEKSAAQFYMMQYRKMFATNQIVPLQFLVESLRGPIAIKHEDGWGTTVFVEYHRMLPYVGFISSWLSRKDLCLPSSHDYNARSAMDMGENELTQGRIAALPHSENRKIFPTKGPSQNMTTDENVMKKLKKRSEASEPVKEKRIIDSLFDDDDYEYLKGSLFGTSNTTQSASDLTKTRPKSEDTNKKLNSKIVLYKQRRENISSAQQVETPSLLKSNDTLSRDKKIAAKNSDMNTSSHQSVVAVTGNPTVHFEALDNVEMRKNKKDSGDIRNALALLCAKLQEMGSEFCTMGDMIVLYEDFVHRIRDGGDADLARQCIKMILSGSDDILPQNEIQVVDKSHKPQTEKQIGFADIFLVGKSSCQDLEITCNRNNWRMPKYSVDPSDGNFLSNVVVGNRYFELRSKGDFECSPSLARESAASRMIAKLWELSIKDGTK